MSDGILGGFGGLDGIKEPRDVHARPKSALEKLIEISELVIKRYAPQIIMDDSITLYTSPVGVAHRSTFVKKVEKYIIKLLQGITFTEYDLEAFIYTVCQTENQQKEKVSLGIYTGCLLHILTEINRSQGKRTNFSINGNGVRFDYLFTGALGVDNLSVANFAGDFICSYIASDGGRANIITLVNILGNNTARGLCGGDGDGSINSVVIAKCKGKQIGSFLGNSLKFIESGKGEASFRKTKTGLVMIVDSEGDAAGMNMAGKGDIDLVILKNHKGDNFLMELWGGDTERKGVKEVIVYNCTNAGKHYEHWRNGYNLGGMHKLVLIHPSISQQTSAKEDYCRIPINKSSAWHLKVFQGDEGVSEYRKIITNQGLERVMHLIDTKGTFEGIYFEEDNGNITNYNASFMFCKRITMLLEERNKIK